MDFLHRDLFLYPPAQPVTKNLWWLDFPFGDENIEYLFFSSDYSLALQEKTTKNLLNQFVSYNLYIFSAVFFPTQSDIWI